MEAIDGKEIRMINHLQEQKQLIRRQMREKIRSQSVIDKKESSIKCIGHLESLKEWTMATRIFGYAPMPSEMDIWPALISAQKSGKEVCLPRFRSDIDGYEFCLVRDLEKDTVPGILGIREPLPHCENCLTNRLDLILIPGIAFDRHGRRLGRGKGYYDRLLANKAGLKCGIAFDYQICDELPIEPHDCILDCILTPTRWFIAGHETVLK